MKTDPEKQEQDGAELVVEPRGANLLANAFTAPQLQKQISEIKWWIVQALVLLKDYKGRCTRRVKIENQRELEYYQPGKVFRFKNIISAYTKEHEVTAEEDGDVNVVFHIYSASGVDVREYVPAGDGLNVAGKEPSLARATCGTILFKPDCEFIVCNKKSDGNITNIYIREINLGLSKNVVLICDGAASSSKFLATLKWLKIAEHIDTKEKDNSHIIKNRSLYAKAYLESKFALLALE